MTHNIIIERDVMVEMRDGIKLAVDIYRPDTDQRYPVLINTHPYGNDSFLVVHELLFSPLIAAQKGFVVVVQELRGTYGSEGVWRYADAGKDAYDTVEWAAVQSWSTGDIGLYGACALGWSSLMGAVEQPPHLKAVFSYMTATNFHDGWTYSSGGALELGFQMSWIWTAMAESTINHFNIEPEEAQAAIACMKEAQSRMAESYAYLPLIDFPPFQGGVAPYWHEWLSHPGYDEYWKKLDSVARASEIQVPVLHMSSWYDTCLKGHMDLDKELRKGPKHVRDKHKMVIFPTDHSAYYNKRPTCAGERDFGAPAMTGPDTLARIALNWFGHHLNGEEIAFMAESKVQYFHMGDNEWRQVDAWPPAHTMVPYYLHSGGSANSRFGDGVLTTVPPAVEPVDSYIYDPLDPVPTVGGRGMIDVPTGVYDQAEVEKRQDILVYTSARLAEELKLNGRITLVLYASSDAPDTDFTAKLVDVEPNGYCANIAEGMIRARYRNSAEKEEFLEPNAVTEFAIDLWDIAHTFKPEHRLRLEVSSSNFPRFDRNLNSRVTPALESAVNARKAVQQIFHDGNYPSRLNLPVAVAG